MRLNGKELDDLNPNELVDLALDCIGYTRLKLNEDYKMEYSGDDPIWQVTHAVDDKLYNLREMVRNATQET